MGGSMAGLRPRGRGAAVVWMFVVAVLLIAASAASAGDVRDIITGLYGGDGITLSEASGFGHDAHFTAESLQGLEDLSTGLASSLQFNAFNAVSTGFLLDIETGIPERTTESFGPLFAETTTTLGEGRLSVSFSYAHVKFDRFEGDKLDDLQLTFQHPDSNGDGVLAPFVPFPGGPLLDFELDTVQVLIDLELKQEIFALYLDYGLSDRWDVGVVIPVIHVEAEANALAMVVDGTTGTPSPHSFDPTTGDSPRSRNRETATGIGDIIIRTKYRLRDDEGNWPSFAVTGRVVLPTGREEDLLGLGETRLQLLAIIAKKFGSISPHLNLGYEWVPGESELNSVRYVGGVDYSVHPRVTLAADVLGRWEHDGDDVGDHLLDLGVSGKFELFTDTLFTAGLLFPLNRDEGLRADVIWVVGLEHTF